MSGVALVTGASRGIGRAVALKLADDGFAVAVNYAASVAKADAVVEQINASGGAAIAVQADVSDPDAVTAMVEKIESDLGPITVLVNNAGITDDGLLLRMSPDQWDRVLSTNLRSVFLCTKAVLRGMIRAKGGRVINISSVSGVAGNAGQANYAASKAGVIGFTKSIAKEVGSRGITVNAVAPGYIDTEHLANVPGAAEKLQKLLDSIPTGRFGTVAECGAIFAFLASEDAAFATGQVYVMDGAETTGGLCSQWAHE